jgi:hypothetical protein
MNSFLKLLGIIHFTKLYPDTTKTMVDTAFKVIVAFVLVWMVAIGVIVWLGLQILKF